MLDAAADVEFLCIPDFLKATPAEENGHRYIYFEAANQDRDYQNERVLANALAGSRDYYLRYGNIDLDHITQVGPKRGIADYARYEIGRPLDVRLEGPRVHVKGEIYRGDTPVAENANHFWDSITKLSPPQRWYPSVGGAVLERGEELDPETNAKHTIIRKVRWTNVGLSKTPVNPSVPTVSAVPYGILMKSWGARGLDLTKALEAGYGTDAPELAGGAALRRESLDRKIQSYWDFRERLSGDVRNKSLDTLRPEQIVAHARRKYGLGADDAAEWTEHFLSDLRAGLNQRTGVAP